MRPFLIASSPTISHEEEAQVKRRRIRPTKHIPTQITQLGIGESVDRDGRDVMASAAK